MGRKSSAKSQTRPSPASSATPPPPGEPRRSYTPLLAVAVIVVAAVIGVFVATRSAQTTPPPQSSASTPPPAQPAVDEPPAAAKFGPHKQDRLPPLPFDPVPPARPADVVRAAYTFAAEHPEVLGYVPCYCGCERSGHRGNDDCFVAARNANGDVTEWEPHGMT
jgi:uncharacterized protein with PCYCGC motif